VTEDTFPTIHRRSQIIQKFQTELSPPEVALKTMLEKNKELKELIHHFKIAPETEPVGPLSMQLQGKMMNENYCMKKKNELTFVEFSKSL
jgi:hypothetical protein